MDVEKPGSWEKPLVDPDGTERPFYEAAQSSGRSSGA